MARVFDHAVEGWWQVGEFTDKTFAMEEEEEGSDEKGNVAPRERMLTPISREGAPAMLMVETIRRAAPDAEFYGPPQRAGSIAYECRAAQFGGWHMRD